MEDRGSWKGRESKLDFALILMKVFGVGKSFKEEGRIGGKKMIVSSIF